MATQIEVPFFTNEVGITGFPKRIRKTFIHCRYFLNNEWRTKFFYAYSMEDRVYALAFIEWVEKKGGKAFLQ